MAAFSLAWQTFHLPKKGHASEDYEDAFAGDPDRARFAVADGASESLFAGVWASLLVEAYVRSPLACPWSIWLRPARKRWRKEASKRELPWYAENKLLEGDFAALLGVAFDGDRWLAEAVGDCCLFVVRDGRLVRAFPLSKACDFGSRPSLVGSHRWEPGQPRTRRFRLKGACRPGDVFLLMTDALAQWFLKNVEEGHRPWQELHAMNCQEQFVGSLDRLRDNREIRNDDVTFMRILIGPRSGKP
jgi:hypothetical protein